MNTFFLRGRPRIFVKLYFIIITRKYYCWQKELN